MIWSFISSCLIAAIIELLSSIATTLSSAEKPDVESTEGNHDWSGLWDVRSVTKGDFSILDVGKSRGLTFFVFFFRQKASPEH